MNLLGLRNFYPPQYCQDIHPYSFRSFTVLALLLGLLIHFELFYLIQFHLLRKHILLLLNYVAILQERSVYDIEVYICFGLYSSIYQFFCFFTQLLYLLDKCSFTFQKSPVLLIIASITLRVFKSPPIIIGLSSSHISSPFFLLFMISSVIRRSALLELCHYDNLYLVRPLLSTGQLHCISQTQSHAYFHPSTSTLQLRCFISILI